MSFCVSVFFGPFWNKKKLNKTTEIRYGYQQIHKKKHPRHTQRLLSITKPQFIFKSTYFSKQKEAKWMTSVSLWRGTRYTFPSKRKLKSSRGHFDKVTHL